MRCWMLCLLETILLFFLRYPRNDFLFIPKQAENGLQANRT